MCWFILDERQYGQCVEVTAVVFVKRTQTNRRMNLTQNLMCSIMFWKWKTGAHDRGVPIRMAWKWNRIMKWFVSICLFAELYDIVNYRLSLSLSNHLYARLKHPVGIYLFFFKSDCGLSLILLIIFSDTKFNRFGALLLLLCNFNTNILIFAYTNFDVWMWRFVCLRFFLFTYFVLAHK